MSLHLTILNRQRTRAVNSRQLRQIITTLLNDLLAIQEAELGVTLVAAPEMTRLNETYLQHEGSTDVITFDYSDGQNSKSKTRDPRPEIHGELLICVDEAIVQARRFGTTWQSEVVRYIIHSVLHLLGYDDHRAADRRKMKRAENQLLRLLVAKFEVQALYLRR